MNYSTNSEGFICASAFSLIMSRHCKRMKHVVGKHGKLRGHRIKRCAKY